MRGRTRQVAILAAIAVNLTLNALAGAGVLFSTQTGAVSDGIPTGLTPAAWAFSIWSVIFAGVLVLGIWQALPARRSARYDVLGWPLVVANLLNGLWQIPWLLRAFGVSALLIAGILASLIWLYVRLDRMELKGSERWALGIPVALFMAWLAVATPLNITIALIDAGWTSTDVLWPAVLVLVVAGIGAWLVSQTADLAVAGVLGWAFIAIWAKNGGAVLGWALLIGALLFLGALAAALWRGQSPWPTTH